MGGQPGHTHTEQHMVSTLKNRNALSFQALHTTFILQAAAVTPKHGSETKVLLLPAAASNHGLALLAHIRGTVSWAPSEPRGQLAAVQPTIQGSRSCSRALSHPPSACNTAE